MFSRTISSKPLRVPFINPNMTLNRGKAQYTGVSQLLQVGILNFQLVHLSTTFSYIVEVTNQIKIKLDKIAHYKNEVGKLRVFRFIKTSPLFDFVIAR